MTFNSYIEDWVVTYCHSNQISLTVCQLSEITCNIAESLSQKGCENIADIEDDVLAEIVNSEVEDRK